MPDENPNYEGKKPFSFLSNRIKGKSSLSAAFAKM
jgi:hypothetical protein